MLLATSSSFIFNPAARATAPRLVAQLGDHRFHVRDRRGIEHAGEVVDVAAGRRDGDLQQGAAEGDKYGRSESYAIIASFASPAWRTA